MYHIMSHMFQVTAVLLLSSLSTFPIPVSALNGYIEPGGLSGSVVVEQGADFQLNCTLSNVTTDSRTAVDIRWNKGSTALPTDWYSAISDSVSQLSLTNITFDQSASYSCGFQEDSIETKIWVEVLVGTKPEPVTLECIIRSPDEYRCSWEETTPTNLRTTHQFQFRSYFGGEWKDCPLCPSCNENTCIVGMAYNTGVRQEVRVKTTNVLGEAVTTQSFDPYNDVVVNPPRDVKVTTLSTETSLKITWFLPSDWHRITGNLEYKLRIKKAGCQMTNLTCCCWTQVTDVGRTDSLVYVLQGLEPYTEYVVQLAARFGLDEKNWSEWTPPKTNYTRQTAPSETVGILTLREEDSLNNVYLRDVFLEWEELQVQNRHGIIHRYNIVALQTVGSEIIERLEWNSTRPWFKIQGLHKYFSYQIKVAALNQAGRGPWASVSIADRTTAPNAPDRVQVVPVSTTSINVTWVAPSEPNGIIQSYIIQWRKRGTDENMQTYMTGNALHRYHVLEHLDTYVVYDVSVRARNSRGDGGLAFASDGGLTLPGVPDAAPSGLTVTPINDQPDSLTLAWEPLPVTNINGDLQGYLIGYCKSNSSCTGESLQHMNLSSPDFTSTTIKGLEPSTQYSVWLAAYTSVGVGPDSDHVLATTRDEATVVIVVAVLVPLIVVVVIIIIIACVIRQVISSRSIPDPKMARNVDVMKMNGVNGMFNGRKEQEIFDILPSDDSHTLETVVIEDLKKQISKFSRSVSNDSGFSPSPARSSANLDYLRDKLSNGDVDDNVFEEEHGRMEKVADKKSSGFTSQTSRSDSVGPYTMIGELPPLSVGLGPSSVTSKKSPSSPSVVVSPYTQMSALLGSHPENVLPLSEVHVPANKFPQPRQQENQNKNKPASVGSNENQTGQHKEVSPYTLMSAMGSMQHRQPKRCQERSVGASKCKKLTHLLSSAPTLSVPSQMLAMEDIKQKNACQNQKSLPQSPSTVSPYSKIEDLTPPSFTAKSSSNNPTATSTQLVSPYIQMPEVNFLNPKQPQTNELRQLSLKTTTDIQTHKPLPILTQPVSPYIQIPEVKPMQPKHHKNKGLNQIPPSCAVESLTCKPSALTTNPAAPETLTSDTAASQTNQQKGLPSETSPNDSPSVFQQPVSPYIQAPGVNFLQLTQAQTDQSKQHPTRRCNKGHPPSPHTLQQSVLPYIQIPRTEQIQQQADCPTRELPPDTDSNNTPGLSHPVTPYIQIPEMKSPQLIKSQTNQTKQNTSCDTDGQPAQQQTVSTQNKVKTPHPSKQDIVSLPEVNDSESTTHNPAPALPQAVSPHTQIQEIKTLQSDRKQTNQPQGLPSENSDLSQNQDPLPRPTEIQIPETKTLGLPQQQTNQLRESQPVSPQPGSSYIQSPETKTLQLANQPNELTPRSENQTQSPPSVLSQSVSPEDVSPYVQISASKTPQLGLQQANQSEELTSNIDSSENQVRSPSSVSPQSFFPEPGSPYVQIPASKTLQLDPQQANQSGELTSSIDSNENQARSPSSVSPQSVSPGPRSPYVQIPASKTLQLGPQQANQSGELTSSIDSNENQARSPSSVSPQSVSPGPGSPYVQIPASKTLQLGPQQANQSGELTSSIDSNENQARSPSSVSPQSVPPGPGSPYVQIPASKTLQLDPQQANQSGELTSSIDSNENQAGSPSSVSPQSVSPGPGSPYVQIPASKTLQLGPQQANQSGELTSSIDSNENQAGSPSSVSPQSVSPGLGSPYVQIPASKTLQLGPQQANQSGELTSSIDSNENQARSPSSVSPQSVSPGPGSPYVQIPESN